MSYVIFETETTRLFRVWRQGYWQNATYADEGAAKTAMTKLAKAGKIDTSTHSIMERSEFNKIEKTETVINLMSGQPVVQSVNTPRCCDVSSELYWSM
jgi:hypothetical protein